MAKSLSSINREQNIFFMLFKIAIIVQIISYDLRNPTPSKKENKLIGQMIFVQGLKINNKDNFLQIEVIDLGQKSSNQSKPNQIILNVTLPSKPSNQSQNLVKANISNSKNTTQKIQISQVNKTKETHDSSQVNKSVKIENNQKNQTNQLQQQILNQNQSQKIIQVIQKPASKIEILNVSIIQPKVNQTLEKNDDFQKAIKEFERTQAQLETFNKLLNSPESAQKIEQGNFSIELLHQQSQKDQIVQNILKSAKNTQKVQLISRLIEEGKKNQNVNQKKEKENQINFKEQKEAAEKESQLKKWKESHSAFGQFADTILSNQGLASQIQQLSEQLDFHIGSIGSLISNNQTLTQSNQTMNTTLQQDLSALQNSKKEVNHQQPNISAVQKDHLPSEHDNITKALSHIHEMLGKSLDNLQNENFTQTSIPTQLPVQIQTQTVESPQSISIASSFHNQNLAEQEKKELSKSEIIQKTIELAKQQKEQEKEMEQRKKHPFTFGLGITSEQSEAEQDDQNASEISEEHISALIKEGAKIKENVEVDDDLLEDAFKKEKESEKMSHPLGQQLNQLDSVNQLNDQEDNNKAFYNIVNERLNVLIKNADKALNSQNLSRNVSVGQISNKTFVRQMENQNQSISLINKPEQKIEKKINKPENSKIHVQDQNNLKEISQIEIPQQTEKKQKQQNTENKELSKEKKESKSIFSRMWSGFCTFLGFGKKNI